MAFILPDVLLCPAFKSGGRSEKGGRRSLRRWCVRDETGRSGSDEVGERLPEEIIMFDGFGGWGYVAMTFGMLVLVALLFGAGVALSRGERRRGMPPLTSSAEDLLAGRFARAEIDEFDYVGRRAVLRERVSS